MTTLKYISLLFLPLFLSACSTLSYYGQGAKGHMELMSKRQPIADALKDPKITEERKKDLQVIQEARQFGYEQLHLPKNKSYSQYVELGREAVTWNLVATPKYSMLPVSWCFPITGCLAYKGYFSKAATEKEAQTMQEMGYETYISGSSAYSTLGWFSDPLVSTMFSGGVVYAAETVFHELAHQKLYLKSNTHFNEAFATAVAEEGVRAWLKRTRPAALPHYEAALEKNRQFLQLLMNTVEQLNTVYQSPLEEAEKEKRKQQTLQTMQEHYQKLKSSWGGYDGYDAWFDKPVNNARLALVGIYHQYVPDFVRYLRKDCNNDFECFYAEMEKLGELPESKQLTALQQLKTSK